LCSWVIQWVIRHDKKGVFRFSQLQNKHSQAVLKEGEKRLDLDTVLLLYKGGFYERSDVAVKIFNLLGGIWKLLGIFKFIPRFLRDWCYNFIAKNRYSWFGRKENCLIPSPSLKARFI